MSGVRVATIPLRGRPGRAEPAGGYPLVTLATGHYERRIRAQPAGISELRRGITAHAQTLGIDDRVVERVALAVSEALTNVVLHAYVGSTQGSMGLEAWNPDSHLVVLVSDEGRGMIPRDDSPGLGLGLGLIERVADDLRISGCVDGPGTEILMSFALGDGTGGAERSDWSQPAPAGKMRA